MGGRERGRERGRGLAGAGVWRICLGDGCGGEGVSEGEGVEGERGVTGWRGWEGGGGVEGMGWVCVKEVRVRVWDGMDV